MMKKLEYEYDVFISHAVEDKIPIANQLYQLLRERNLNVWYSGRELSVGDRLTPTIHQGMDKCRFGVVIISPTYLSKIWALNEFFFLLTREKHGEKVVLPVLYDITPEELAYRSPLMADIFAVRADKGLDHVADVLSTEIMKQYQAKKTYPVHPIQLMPKRRTSILNGAILLLLLLLSIISHLLIPNTIAQHEEIEKTKPTYPQDNRRIRASPEGVSQYEREKNTDYVHSTSYTAEILVPSGCSVIITSINKSTRRALPGNTSDHDFTTLMNLRRQPDETTSVTKIYPLQVNQGFLCDLSTDTQLPPGIITININRAWKPTSSGLKINAKRRDGSRESQKGQLEAKICIRENIIGPQVDGL